MKVLPVTICERSYFSVGASEGLTKQNNNHTKNVWRKNRNCDKRWLIQVWTFGRSYLLFVLTGGWMILMTPRLMSHYSMLYLVHMYMYIIYILHPTTISVIALMVGRPYVTLCSIFLYLYLYQILFSNISFWKWQRIYFSIDCASSTAHKPLMATL